MPYRVRRIKQKEEPNSLKHWKYIKRWREDGKWRYLYPDDIGKNATVGSPSSSMDIRDNPQPTSSFSRPEPRNYKNADEQAVKEGQVASVKEVLETEKEYMSDLESNYKSFSDLPLKDGKWSNSEDSAAINPNYGKATTWEAFLATMTNCVYCSMAYDMRKRGYDVQAVEMPSQIGGCGLSLVYDCDINDITWASELLRGYRDETTDNEEDSLLAYYENSMFEGEYDAKELTKLLETEMLECGEGARGQFIVYWYGGGAHSLVWEIENGKVVIRDTQDNTTSSMIEYVGRSCNVAYIRTDNLNPTDEILKFIKTREE